MNRARIFVVDDDELSLAATRDVLESARLAVHTETSPITALEYLKNTTQDFAVLILDYRMPEMTGAELLMKIREFNCESVAYIYSCDEGREALRESLIAKAEDFIDKSGSVEAFVTKVRNGARIYQEERKTVRNATSTNEKIQETIRSAGFVGVSESLATSIVTAKMLSEQDGPFLIIGETGTGKEMLSKLFIRNPDAPFLTVNCASFTDDTQLMESTLFGHEKGAFTGADRAKRGLFEEAGHGVVFLDEVHLLGRDAQGKLLRAIRERKIRPVGSNIEKPIHCRIVAATQPGSASLNSGSFKDDFLYRIDRFKVRLAPLRERPEDITALSVHYVEDYNRNRGTKKVLMSSAARALELYPWPGNVAELQSVIFSALAMSTRDEITVHDLDEKIRDENATKHVSTFEEFEKNAQKQLRGIILNAFQTSKSVRHAAKNLGMSESSLRAKMKTLGITDHRAS